MKTGLRAIARAIAVTLVASAGFCADGKAPAADYGREIAEVRARRVERLTRPDGWLTLVGLHWLKPGANTIGSGRDNAIVTAGGPVLWGVVTWDAATGRIALAAEPKAGLAIDGKPAGREPVVLQDDGAGRQPTLVTAGSMSLQVIARETRRGLRIKDSQSAARTGFRGLTYFPTDPAWRIVADWVPFDPPRTVKVTNVVGATSDERVPGAAVFMHQGKRYEIWPTQEGPGEPLFFVISDATSGRETYGASRFLYTEVAKDGKVILDLNLLYNPPCAFTPHATCPLPIRQNRLDFPIRAGEKAYREE